MSIEAYAASRRFGKLEALAERDRLAFRQKMAWLVAGACVLAATVVLAGGWIGCDRGLHPTQAADKYNLSLFDLRYRGESEGKVSTLGAKEAWDIEDAVR